MNKAVGNKFKKKFSFVKPLYRRTGKRERKIFDKSDNILNFDRTVKLCGNDFNVKTVVAKDVNDVKHKVNKEFKIVLPGVCDSVHSVDNFKHYKILDVFTDEKNHIRHVKKNTNFKTCRGKMLESTQNSKQKEAVLNDDVNKRFSKDIYSQLRSGEIAICKEPDTWLRVYPAPKLPEETVYSTILRCVLCQLGIISFLVLWTILAVFVIEAVEGPQEVKVSLEFEKEQNQLVIDLATELRQITPLSPKWRYAIEKRIEDERQLTVEAVAEGARLKPGQFWNLPGTFLFTIYVMTALGFGAPVPHTLWGRTSALIYALLAVPTHIYLMVNASTFVVVRLEECTRYLRENCCRKIEINTESTRENSRNSDAVKSTNKLGLRKHLMRCINILGTGRCVPLVTLIYYLIGVISFGVVRNKPAFETIVFPIEFTTTGGLDRVEGFVRILYGVYIEGAMWLLSWALATLRRRNSSFFEQFALKYRLFDYDLGNDYKKHNKEVV